MYGGHFTISLKNAVGLVNKKNMSELHSSKNQREMIAEINGVYNPDLIMMDGVTTFLDRRPMKGTCVEANLFVAGTDKREVELGLGVKSARYIEYLTDSEENVKLVAQIKEKLALYTRISKNKIILLPPTKLIHSTRNNFHLKKKMTM